ncbi:MAG: ZIP family metal transporter [Firmicutes bacterium]|jgi:ZIP family zinc transporter|nr:ZIP family metal transporter [Bacillota bacterium]
MILWPQLLATLAAGAAAGIGALPLLFIQHIPTWLQGSLLGFAGGMMTGAALLSLLPSALNKGGLVQVMLGITAGAGALMVLDKLLPHQHVRSGKPKATEWQSSLMIIAAIILHNLPEGLTMGVGYAAGEDQIGLILTVAIGIQNLPEGLLAALPLRENGVSGPKAVGLALLTGLVEPAAALIGMLLVDWLQSILGFFLAFAAGAMLYTVSDTLIPDSHEHGFERLGTYGFLAGVMTLLLIRQLLK